MAVRDDAANLTAPTMEADTEKQKASCLEVIDVVHDEGLNVIAHYDGEDAWTSEEERSLSRKVDRRLLPMLIGTYFLLCYDKVMLGQAASLPNHSMDEGRTGC